MSPTPSSNGHRGPPEIAFAGVVRAYGLIQRVMRPYFLQFGLNSSQWAILRHLLRAEDEESRSEGLRLVEIGQRLLVQPPSVTTLVRRLVKANLVHSTASLSDRRSVYLRLTPQGRSLVKQVLQQHRQQIRQVLGGLDDQELTVFGDLLQRLNSHLAANATGTAQGVH